MTPFFEDKFAQAMLITALEERAGMPFRHTVNGTRGGYNCWHLILEAYTAGGVDTSSMRNFPPGSLNWGKFHRDSRILKFLHEDPTCRKFVKRLDPSEPIMCADLLAVVQDVSSNHLAIAESDKVAWQIPRGGTVGRISIQVLRPYIHSVYRIYK